MDTILIVKDDAFLRDGLTESLMREGCEPVAAATLAAARAVLARRRVSLILLDALLPDGTGFDLCTELRRGFRRH